MWKHEVTSHGLGEEPEFGYRIVKFFRTALERQVYEAVHLKTLAQNPNIQIMNSKGEYSRCRLSRCVYKDLLVAKLPLFFGYSF